MENKYIRNASATLGRGLNTLANFWFPLGWGTRVGMKIVAGGASGFFPAEQREKIVDSNVSKQPYTSYFGFRPTAPEAPTLRTPFQQWWQTKVVKPVKDYYMGFKTQELGRESAKVLTEVATTGIRRIGDSLTDHYMTKWGLKPRPSEPGDRYAYLNQGQSRAPATEVSPAGFFGMYPSQPVGSYFMGNPQSSPMPVNVVVEKSDYPGAAGAPAGISPVILLVIAGIVLFITFRKK